MENQTTRFGETNLPGKCWVGAIALILGFQLLAGATPLEVSGNTSWQQNGSVVTIRVDRISNSSSTGTSGSIRLQLWATAARYAGGNINGYVLASYQFPQVLGPSQYFYDVSRTVPFTTPPTGTYYTTLTVEEYAGSAWVIRDYVTYTSTSTFGPGGSPGLAALSFSGNTSWQQNGSVVTLRVDRISNTSTTGTSGSIRLQLWATAARYAGGNINGYVLAAYQFPQVLGPNQFYSNVDQTVSFTAPPNGTYNTTLTLEEFSGSGWVIRDYVTYTSTSTFGPGGSPGTAALSLSGNTSWQQNGIVVTIRVDRISNTSTTGTSGSIRLQLWATAARYAGGNINGYVLAAYQFPQVLGPNQFYSNVDQTVSFTAPPNGTYNTTLTLEEFTASGWVIRDYVTYDSTSTFGPRPEGNTPPFGFLDYPGPGSALRGTVPVYGWALDTEDSSLTISLALDGQLVSSSPARAVRPDVCNAYRSIVHCSSSSPGWSFSWNTQNVSNGAHTLSVVARDAQGAQVVFSTVVTVSNEVAGNTSPFGYLDYPSQGTAVQGTVPVFGWALDTEDSSLTISLTLDGQLISSNPARGARADVCNTYRSIAHCSSSSPGWGFSWNTQVVSNGPHTLSVVARDPRGAQVMLSTVVTVSNEAAGNTSPFGYLDYPSQGTAVRGTVPVYGWALDTEDSSLTISLTLDGQLISSNPARGARADVCNSYRSIAHCSASNPGWGFSWNTQGVSNGPHTLSVVARDPRDAQVMFSTVVTVSNEAAGNTSPVGYLDYPPQGMAVRGSVPVYGWALDAEDSGLTISLTLDGQLISSNPARGARADVCNSYRSIAHCSASNPGWMFNWNTQDVSIGAHTLSVIVRDSQGAQISFSRVVNIEAQPAIITSIGTGFDFTPRGIAVLGGGFLIAADIDRNRVVKIGPNGEVTVVAGTGTAGFNGDGPATSRQLNAPTSVAVDGAGYIYIADSGNNRIRQVSPTGLMQTIAGTGQAGYDGDNKNAISARLNVPSSVAVDSSFRVYIADTFNNRIRRIASGVITTVAGDGTAFPGEDGTIATRGGMFQPRGVAVDRNGNVYYSDTLNGLIRRVNASGIVTTIAGSVTGGGAGNGDGGPATSARLTRPWGIDVDLSGNLYIADPFDNRIRRVSPEGIINTIAGTGTQGFSGDGGAPTSAELNRPAAIASDYFESVLYIADTENHRIRKVSLGRN